jgi:hypothetical protein
VMLREIAGNNPAVAALFTGSTNQRPNQCSDECACAHPKIRGIPEGRVSGTLRLVDLIAWFNKQASERPRCDEYVGLTVQEVTERVGAEHLRVVDTDQATATGRLFLTSDLRHDRVNVFVRDGLVTAAAKF